MNEHPHPGQARFMPRIIVIALLLGLSYAGSAPAEQLEGVLDQMIAAYGGEENLRKLDHQTQYWDLVAMTRKAKGTEVRNLELPDRLDVMLNYPDRREARRLNGNVALVAFNDQHPAHASEPQQKAMMLQMMRLYSPLALRERIDALQLEREDHYLTLTLHENDLRADYLVNGETWRIEKVIGTLHIGGQQMQFLTEYSEFDFVEGVLVHHAENKYAGQTNTARLKLRKIELGVDAENTPPDFEHPVTRL